MPIHPTQPTYLPTYLLLTVLINTTLTPPLPAPSVLSILEGGGNRIITHPRPRDTLPLHSFGLPHFT